MRQYTDGYYVIKGEKDFCYYIHGDEIYCVFKQNTYSNIGTENKKGNVSTQLIKVVPKLVKLRGIPLFKLF